MIAKILIGNEEIAKLKLRGRIFIMGCNYY